MRAGERVDDYTIVSVVEPQRRYLAVHRTLARRVVIEVGGADDVVVHPGVARVVDRGDTWRAIELVDGTPLASLLRRPLLAVEAAILVRDVAEVLSVVHARGAVHGALAIGSIIITAEAPGVSIRDWGDRAVGPNAFTPPEGAGDASADVFALGVIAYRAIARVFPGINPNLDTSPELAKLVARMLARDPAARPSSADIRATATAIVTQLRHRFSADDRVGGGPRFARPKWTPPPPDGDGRPRSPILGSDDQEANSQ